MLDIEEEIKKKFPTINSAFIKQPLINIAKKIIHQDDINTFLKNNDHLLGLEFVDAVLDYFDFDFTSSSNSIQNIPVSGKVVIISNHPLGGLDALCLLKLVGSVRKDIKIVANDFLQEFKALESLMLPLNNFKNRQNKDSIKNIYEALNNEEAIIIFPAGEVSRATAKGIKDSAWNQGFLNFAKRSNAPILPILIDAKNSKFFYTISIINKTFSTLLLSNEMFKNSHNTINIKVGEIISAENTIPKGLKKEYLSTLYKKHLYALKKEKKSYFETQKAIAHPQKRQDILKELNNSLLLGVTPDKKKIYLYKYQVDSVILKELGRLRELSFRKVGEGVNKKRDTDKYDVYYEHIILWDEKDLEIVGSYRVGNAKFINDNYGISGFYSNSLFKFTNDFIPYLNSSIELGRSFVQPKYWGSRALDYLWFGIGAYLKINPHVKYMFGPVSLSSTLPIIAKDMLIYYYSNYYKSKKNLVNSKRAYQYLNDKQSISSLFNNQDLKEDFKVLKSSLNELSCTVPTLYKQYSNLCEYGGIQFHGFNIDKNFSDCIDGFILVNVNKIKKNQRARYID